MSVARARAGSPARAPAGAERLRRERPGEPTSPREELKKVPKGPRQVYDAPQPRGARIQDSARSGGLEKPGT